MLPFAAVTELNYSFHSFPRMTSMICLQFHWNILNMIKVIIDIRFSVYWIKILKVNCKIFVAILQTKKTWLCLVCFPDPWNSSFYYAGSKGQGWRPSWRGSWKTTRQFLHAHSMFLINFLKIEHLYPSLFKWMVSQNPHLSERTYKYPNCVCGY